MSKPATASAITRTIDINENRNRYYFTREATQKDMEGKYGVSVKTVGKYYPNRSLATPTCPPLTLHLTGDETAVCRAEEYVSNILQNGPPPAATSRPRHPAAKKSYATKVYLGFQPEPGRVSAVRQHILGPPPSATHLQYIAKTSGPGTTVGLRGQGSGHVELGMSLEQLAEPMHLLLECSTEDELAKAAVLAEDLLTVVKHVYEQQKTTINRM